MHWNKLNEIPNERLKKVMLDKGLKENTDFLFVVDSDGMHYEKCWAYRLPNALEYILN